MFTSNFYRRNPKCTLPWLRAYFKVVSNYCTVKQYQTSDYYQSSGTVCWTCGAEAGRQD